MENKLQQKVNQDLKIAMMNKDEDAKSLLKVIIGEFNRIDKIVPDDKATSIIKKMIENAKVVGNTNEIKILENYLPSQLSDLELRNVISNIVTLYTYSNKDMGKIMSHLKENYAGRYDGKLASTITKEVLG